MSTNQSVMQLAQPRLLSTPARYVPTTRDSTTPSTSTSAKTTRLSPAASSCLTLLTSRR